MTPLAILVLLTTGLIGSAFMTGSDDQADIADNPAGRDGDEEDRDFSNGDLLLDAARDGDDADHASAAPDPEGDTQGSAGHDILEISSSDGETGKTIHGGDGDDFMRTSSVSEEESYTSSDLFESHLSGGNNTVYGGRGDDVIEMSRDDVSDGGEGRDVFVVMADPADITSRGPAIVRDLHADDDVVILNLPPRSHGSQAVPDLQERVEQRTEGDDTIILVDDTIMLRILGQTDLDVGVQEDATAPFSVSNLSAITDASYFDLTGLDGHAIVGPLPSVIVRYYTQTT